MQGESISKHRAECAGAESPALRARRRLEAAVEAALNELTHDTEGLDNRHLANLAPSEVIEEFLVCAEGVSLNLRALETRARRACYEDPACTSVLVARRLPSSAWRDLQSVCEQRFSEIVLPDLLGTDAHFPALRGLKSLRSISMALDAGSRSVDLRPLADLGQPMHVEIRCSSRLDVEVFAPPGISVSAEIEGDILLASCSRTLQLAPEESIHASRVAAHEGVLYQLNWAKAAPPNEVRASKAPRRSWPAKLWHSIASALRSDEKPTLYALRDECFADLEDALASAAQPLGSAARYDLRTQALRLLDAVDEHCLDISALGTVSALLPRMKHTGWIALEKYSRASHGHGIRRIRFPEHMSPLRHDLELRATLGWLPELAFVQFGIYGSDPWVAGSLQGR